MTVDVRVNKPSDSGVGISVIVPAFNQERYIGRCLRSLLQQHDGDMEYEIIVVDDCSTDKTRFALDLFIDPFGSRVRVIENESNLGLPGSLNKAILSSSAEYVVRVDSDDFVNKNFLSFLSFFLSSNDDFDAVACDYYTVDDDENVISRFRAVENPIACGIMFRRSQLIDVGLYDEGFRSHEDKEFMYRFSKRHTLGFLELPLYRYRRHDTNMTNNFDEMELYRKKFHQKHGRDIDY